MEFEQRPKVQEPEFVNHQDQTQESEEEESKDSDLIRQNLVPKTSKSSSEEHHQEQQSFVQDSHTSFAQEPEQETEEEVE